MARLCTPCGIDIASKPYLHRQGRARRRFHGDLAILAQNALPDAAHALMRERLQVVVDSLSENWRLRVTGVLGKPESVLLQLRHLYWADLEERTSDVVGARFGHSD